MRCAILKLTSKPPIGLVRLLSLAIQETTDRRLSDQPTSYSPRVQEGRTKCQLGCTERQYRGTSSCETQQRRKCCRGPRDPEPKGTGDGEVAGFLASAGAPRDSDVSLAPRGGGRVGRVWIREAIDDDSVPRDQEARLSQDTGQVGPVISRRMNHVSHQIVASDPIAAASANQSVVSPFVIDFSTGRAVRVLGPDGQAKSHAPAPGMRLRQK